MGGAIEPGRYAGEGNGSFVVRCLACLRYERGAWGKSGPAIAPAVLRDMGWKMRGERIKARWSCPECSRSTS